MNLPYDGEYRSYLITQFRTMRDPQDIMLLLQAINVLFYLTARGVKKKSLSETIC
jgi:hypothetical protein